VKGSQVYVEGRLQTRDWTDRDGQKRKTTEVIVGYLTMLDRKREGAGNSSYADSGSGSYSQESEPIPF